MTIYNIKDNNKTMNLTNLDFTSGSLVGLTAFAGGATAELFMKGNYTFAAIFLVIALGASFAREYWKVS